MYMGFNSIRLAISLKQRVFFLCSKLVTPRLRSGGGVGDIMIATDYQQHLGYYLARYAFDFSFFLIIIVIFIAIISGIDNCHECTD